MLTLKLRMNLLLMLNKMYNGLNQLSEDDRLNFFNENINQIYFFAHKISQNFFLSHYSLMPTLFNV